MQQGKFIVLDGIDGAGTTTHTEKLADWLISEGFSVLWTQEPTNRRVGSFIQDIIKNNQTSGAVDALLFAADRLDHFEKVIRPALNEGKIVISDRYIEASIAYQTAAGVRMEWIEILNQFVENPDLTIILDIDPERGLERKVKIEDKFETVPFLEKVRQIYLERAKTQHYPVVKTSRAISEVQEDLRKLARAILK
jgi:dTMP kinase